jgi:hypothetical protein
MEIIKNGCIKNWSPVFGQRPEGYGIEVTPVCPGTGRNFDNRGDEHYIILVPLFQNLWICAFS